MIYLFISQWCTFFVGSSVSAGNRIPGDNPTVPELKAEPMDVQEKEGEKGEQTPSKADDFPLQIQLHNVRSLGRDPAFQPLPPTGQQTTTSIMATGTTVVPRLPLPPTRAASNNQGPLHVCCVLHVISM